MDKDAVLDLLETAGDRVDGEETFEIVFLATLPLLALLSWEVEVSLLEVKEDEIDGVDLIVDVLAPSLLVSFPGVSDSFEDFKLLSADEIGTDLPVSGTFVRGECLETTEDNELLLSSGRERLVGSDVGVLMAAALFTLFCFFEEVGDFSGNPPVLFLLVTGTEVETRVDPIAVDFGALELEFKADLDSMLLLTELVFGASVAEGFTVFILLFAFPEEMTAGTFCELGCLITISSLGMRTGSSNFIPPD